MQVCTLLQPDNHANTPPLSFLQAGCPSCRPTNSVKALKALNWLNNWLVTFSRHLLIVGAVRRRKRTSRRRRRTLRLPTPRRYRGLNVCWRSSSANRMTSLPDQCLTDRVLTHTHTHTQICIAHDFVRNYEVSLRTGLAPVSDRITRGRNAIFGHVARLPVNTPAHQHAKSSYRLVDPQTLHGNVHQVDHVPNRPTNSAAITTMFPLRLCGGKLLVAVTRERRYGPSRLRVNR